MSIKNFASKKFSQIVNKNSESSFLLIHSDGILYEVVVSRYHRFYLFVKRVGYEFPVLNCSVKGNQCLNDFIF